MDNHTVPSSRETLLCVFFYHLSKVIKIMRAYMVPPYGIRWEERRKKCFILSQKDSHLDMQLMSRRHAEYENMLEIR